MKPEQQKTAEAAAQVKLDSPLWIYYVGRASGGAETYAYFETHTVRSETETFMAVLDASGEVAFVELLAFHEPDDYKPAKKWLGQFHGKGLGGEVFVRRGIRNITGASLTSAALTDGVRRVLAVHAILHPKRSP